MLIQVNQRAPLASDLLSRLKMERRQPYKLVHWSLGMRVLSLTMAFLLFMLPQVLTSQSILNMYEECDSQPPPIIEEEVLKHACTIHRSEVTHVPADDLIVLFQQYEDRMLDHPLLEVPHQPPRS